MVVLRVVAFAAGAAVIAFTVRSVIRTFLVPRALEAKLARLVFVGTRRLFRLWANARHSYERRDAVMAFYAPVALLALLVTWIVLISAGYTLVFYALGGRSLVESFTLAGSSLFTLGFAAPGGYGPSAISFSAGGIGLVVLALFIAYLPTLYGAFQRRERGVAKLEVRAGQPPTGVYLIELAWTVGRLENLRDLWAEWEDWFTDVDESHSSFPALIFFRSPHPDQSWITAAGAILDGASLFASSIDVVRQPEPEFMIRSGYLCLRHLADFLKIPVDHDPRPEDPISIDREEFEVAYSRLLLAGVPVKLDRDQAWRDFAGWRVNYDAALIGLARLTMAPPAPWSSDRSLRAPSPRDGRADRREDEVRPAPQAGSDDGAAEDGTAIGEERDPTTARDAIANGDANGGGPATSGAWFRWWPIRRRGRGERSVVRVPRRPRR